jgi:hypothetical protein
MQYSSDVVILCSNQNHQSLLEAWEHSTELNWFSEFIPWQYYFWILPACSIRLTGATLHLTLKDFEKCTSVFSTCYFGSCFGTLIVGDLKNKANLSASAIFALTTRLSCLLSWLPLLWTMCCDGWLCVMCFTIPWGRVIRTWIAGDLGNELQCLSDGNSARQCWWTTSTASCCASLQTTCTDELSHNVGWDAGAQKRALGVIVSCSVTGTIDCFGVHSGPNCKNFGVFNVFCAFEVTDTFHTCLTCNIHTAPQ